MLTYSVARKGVTGLVVMLRQSASRSFWEAAFFKVALTISLLMLAASRIGMGQRLTCLGSGAGPLVVTSEKLGQLPFDVSVDSLRKLCVGARDTLITSDGGRTYPGMDFSNDGSVVVIQYSNTSKRVDGNRPGEGWIIRGQIILPGGLSLDKDWTQLRQVLGPHQTSLGKVVVVKSCQFPRFLFTLDAPASSVRTSSNGQVDEETIPGNARVHHMTVLSGPLSNALTPC